MRNILQLVGGVAVAGAVAAGATAFTASGVTLAAGPASGIVAGGGVTVNVSEGAQVKTASVTQDVANPDRITGVVVDVYKVDGTTVLGASSVVKAKVTGTGGTAGAAAWSASCSKDVNNYTYTCTIAAGYYNAVSTIEIGVIPGA